MPPSKSREKRDFSVFDPVPGSCRPCQVVGTARERSAEGPAALGREMEIVLLCFLAAIWSRWFWSVLLLWTLAESVVILRRWEGLLGGV